jgi:hypothetical protein
MTTTSLATWDANDQRSRLGRRAVFVAGQASTLDDTSRIVPNTDNIFKVIDGLFGAEHEILDTENLAN